MPKIIAVVNQKGGVGKTTTTINVCAYLASQYPILLVDLDSQANATASLGIDMSQRQSIHDVLVQGTKAKDVILETSVPQLFVLPSSPSLVAAELQLAALMGREFKLRRALQELGDTYRYTFIDCPPALSLLTLNALAAAQRVMVPVQCEYLSLEGLSELLTTIELVQMNLNPQLELGGIIMTMYDPRTALSKQVVDEVRNHFPSTFKTVIPRNVRVAEAPSHGMPLVAFAPDSPGAVAYKALAVEIGQALERG